MPPLSEYKLLLRSRKWLLIILLLCGLVKGYMWWGDRNDGFTLNKIQSYWPVEKQWVVSYTSQQYEEAVTALQQPFTYLGRGFQCYAFESLDGQYVLKFFRHHRLRLTPVLMELPSFPLFESWRKRKLAKLNARRLSLLNCFKTAQEYVAYEAGLVCTHLNVTKDLFPEVEIIDKVGDRYIIALDQYQFILQYKADHIKPTLLKLAQERKFDEARARIDQIFKLLAVCAKKGIQDIDGRLIEKNNIGFLKDRAIYIDGGQLVRNNSIKNKEYFIKDLGRLRALREWMQQSTPELVPIFLESKRHAIDSF